MKKNIKLNKKKQIREKIKEKLKKLEYKEAINTALKYCDNENDKIRLQKNLDKLNNIYDQLKNKQISNEKFYYSINNIVSDFLEIVDDIVGEPDDNWEFFDELSSSLKFNLVNQADEDYSSQDVVFAFNLDGKIVFDYENEKIANDPKIVKLKKLYQQLSYYEEQMKQSNNEDEKAKFRSIIKAIEQRISEEGEKIMNS
jgi:hypothetical protein